MDASAQTPDISVVLTAHREGVLAGATANSAREAIARAEADLGLRCEIVLVLDRTNVSTAAVLEHAFDGMPLTVLRTEEGDPGQARNAGIAAARGVVSTFLDADDLWSGNWLTEGWKLIEARPDCVGHSHCNLVFGGERGLWWHVDSEGSLFDPDYLAWANYWDAMSIARTDLYRRVPFRANDLSLGFGHEDWHWNRLTWRQGIAHKPVPHTMHFKRRRPGSQMSLVEKADALIWPD
jgi:glycosyltransferase involved in cell wall biosynthesis